MAWWEYRSHTGVFGEMVGETTRHLYQHKKTQCYLDKTSVLTCNLNSSESHTLPRVLSSLSEQKRFLNVIDERKILIRSSMNMMRDGAVLLHVLLQCLFLP